MSATEWLAAAWPRPVSTAPALERATTRLGTDADAETIERAARTVASVAVVAAVAIGLAVVVRGWRAAGVLVVVSGALGGVCTPTIANRSVRFAATMARTRALGSAATLVGRAALSLRIEPSIERAAVFAARTGRSALARSLGRHVRRAANTSHSGFDGFAADWGAQFRALDRAVARLDAAASASADERGGHLDRAVAAALRGAREDLSAFTTDIRGPVTGLYAFGVLLPLALVAVLPAARATGVALSLPVVVALYDAALPLVVVGAGAWLLARRPIAFPPPRIGRDHPDTPDSRVAAVTAGLVAAGVGGWIVARGVDVWAAPVAAVGFGVGTALVARFRPAKRVRDRVLAVEADLHDALYLVGRRVAAGDAVETAVETAAKRVPGTTGAYLENAVDRHRRLDVTVREAFGGMRVASPSRRVREMADLFALAATEGRPAGEALVATAEHFEEMRRIERESRRELRRVTDTLANTAAVFGPLVGGATVALSERVSQTGATPQLGAAPLPTAGLGVAVGAYVLWLAVALTVLTTGLTRGLDRTLVGYRVGVSLCLATTCYFLAYVAAGLFL
ncbi:type II secretion system protein [Haloplanus halobius]|uniref:type II secretion system protein n=1 Tax=Haloplanus halobius TaxID=2934938 RepID=UPI00200C9AA8|nr:type II secretion system protein [Haloplanus sp. XH21]